MTSDVFAQKWPGARGPSRHGQHHGPPSWFFERPGRGGPPFRDIDDLIALGRMWKGGPFGGSSWGPHRRGRGRARRGDVRLALLRLLAEEPRNGYQLMQAIEERSGGRWRPSPGSVYPTLAQLEDQGFVRSTDSDGGRTFETTDTGRKHFADHDQDPPWLGDDEPDTLADLKTQLKQIHIAAALVLRAGSPG